MLQSVLKKIGSFLIILLGITFLSFLLSYLSPSDPVEIMGVWVVEQGLWLRWPALPTRRTKRFLLRAESRPYRECRQP